MFAVALSVAIAAPAVGSSPSNSVRSHAAAAGEQNGDARAVVAEVRKLVRQNYVLPDVGAKLDAVLGKGLAEGRYKTDDPMQLAQRLNDDFNRTAHDKHLSIHFSPAEASTINPNQSDDNTDNPAFGRMAQMRNYGISQMKVLQGNIRYVALDGFAWTGPKTAQAYDTAVRFMQGGDAIILDLRRNGGGNPEAVRYLVSHFLEGGKPLVTFYTGGKPTQAFFSLEQVPEGRLLGKPLYVLTSGHTGSAAEEFAGHVAGYHLGELVGENTAGGGFRNSLFPVAGKYVLSVSVGRAILASTGTGWEGKGIAPTIQTDAERALDVAQMRAAQKLASEAQSQHEKMAYADIAAKLKARVEPATPALPLAAYAGRFGEANVVLKDGRLIAETPDGEPRVLLPLGQNLFAVDGESQAKVEFQVADRVTTELDVLLPNGRRMKMPRSSQP